MFTAVKYYLITICQRFKFDRSIERLAELDIWSKSDKALARSLLSEFSKICIKLDIYPVLGYGTLLGYVRHNGIIPWDDDIDILIDIEDISKMTEMIYADERLNIGTFVHKESGQVFYKVWWKHGNQIPEKEYLFPFIDIWTYRIDERAVISGELMLPYEMYFPLRKVSFEGAPYQIPNNSQYCLDLSYTNWRNAIQVFPWSHRIEGVGNRPIVLPILTNKYGRLLRIL